jgi:hypothetical protein
VTASHYEVGPAEEAGAVDNRGVSTANLDLELFHNEGDQPTPFSLGADLLEAAELQLQGLARASKCPATASYTSRVCPEPRGVQLRTDGASGTEELAEQDLAVLGFHGECGGSRAR